MEGERWGEGKGRVGSGLYEDGDWELGSVGSREGKGEGMERGERRGVEKREKEKG